jgi:protein-L-isoaspartate(D-aspartate) O-methyltransferase
MIQLETASLYRRLKAAVHAGATLAFAALALPAQPAPASDDARLASARDRMVDEVAAMMRETARSTGRANLSPSVVEALRSVPRHRFVPPALVDAAYDNRPLPIGAGQTISQPYIVALSTELIEPQPGHVVLEVGTGSGYQAAVLAAIVRRVYSIEIVESLGREAQARLQTLGHGNVEVRIGDGYRGWPEHAPFDGIIVTAAAPHVPEPLVQQLKPGGRMVIPVGSGPFGQDLLLIEKSTDGSVKRRVVLPVRFVPLTGEGARK